MPQNEQQDQPRSPDGSSPDTAAADTRHLNFAEVGQQLGDRPQDAERAAVSAQQGPAPADLTERAAPPVPKPSEHGLSAREVARLTGEDGDSSSDAADGNPDAALDVSES